MADAGDLQKFPLEIRKEIYKYVLVESKPIAIECYINRKDYRSGEVARMGNHRKVLHRGQIWNAHNKIWLNAPPSSTSILLVNKILNQEATPVFYGDNDCAFDNSRAIEDFLVWISASKDYLRKVAIVRCGTMFDNALKTFDRSKTLLTAAKGLRALKFSHLAFCSSGCEPYLLDIRLLANHCIPFLQNLQVAHNALGLNTDMLDVVKVILPPCHYESCGKDKKRRPFICCRQAGSPHAMYRRRMISTPGDSSNGLSMRSCGCLCEAAEDKNQALARELREEIAKGLGLAVNDEGYAERT